MTDYISEVLAAWGIWVFQANTGHSLGVKISSAYNPESAGGYRDSPILPETRIDVLKWDKIFRQQPNPLLPEHWVIIRMHYLAPGHVRTKAGLLGLTVRRYNDRLAAAKRQADHFMRMPVPA